MQTAHKGARARRGAWFECAGRVGGGEACWARAEKRSGNAERGARSALNMASDEKTVGASRAAPESTSAALRGARVRVRGGDATRRNGLDERWGRDNKDGSGWEVGTRQEGKGTRAAVAWRR